jgi:hypothetical protein
MRSDIFRVFCYEYLAPKQPTGKHAASEKIRTVLTVMNDQKFSVNSLHVASPCSVGWESMTGDDRARHCHSCRLNVYNISALTGSEVKELVHSHEGRLCIRLYRRPDGTVLTKDCPVGLRKVRKRLAGLAAAAFASVLALFTVSFGQTYDGVPKPKTEITRSLSHDETSSLFVSVRDSAGVVLPGAKIVLVRGKVKRKSTSDRNGICVFKDMVMGTWALTATAPQFSKYVVDEIVIKEKEVTELNIELTPKGVEVTVGIYAGDSTIDTTSTSVNHNITIPR